MERTFFFVDGRHADKHSKRQVRRHVMVGKNAGRIIPRKSRLASRQQAVYDKPVPRSVIGDLKSQLLPLEASPEALKIIHDFFTVTADRLYPVQLGISLHDSKLMWLRILFTDERAYHCNIALIQACNEMLWSDGGSPPKALYHLSETLTMIRQRLQSNEALSDSTIAIVLSLIHQEQIRHQRSAASIHMQGLVKLVQLRGGLDALEDNVGLLLKICKTDIMLALQHGGSTIFYRDRFDDVKWLLASKRVCFTRYACPTLSQHEQLHATLHEVLLDVMSVCSLFNNNTPAAMITLEMFQEMTASLCYRLLRFRTLDHARGRTGLNATCHLGLIMFMMTTFVQFDHRQVVDYALLPLCFKDMLDSNPEQLEDDFVLWLVTMGGICLPNDINRQWIVPKVATAAQRLDVATWADAHRRVIKYPWINALHDGPGQILWSQTRDDHDESKAPALDVCSGS